MENNLYGRCSQVVPGTNNKQIKFDAATFFESILLFDNFVLDTIQLHEIPFLVKTIGINGLIKLLEDDCLKIHCEALTFGQVGQTTGIESIAKNGALPLLNYTFSTIDISSYDKYIEKRLKKELKQLPYITKKQTKKLKYLIRKKLVVLSKDLVKSIHGLFANDASTSSLLMCSVQNVLKEQGYIDVEKLTLQMHRINDGDWFADTNLCKLLRIDEHEGHKIIEKALLNLYGLEHLLCKMQDFDALSGFRDQSQFELFKQKLKPLGEKMNGEQLSSNFLRVRTIKGLPNFDEILNSDKFSIEKLLEIRQTSECKEFRHWLWSSSVLSEKAIKDRVNSFKSKGADFLSSTTGKVIRCAVNVGVSVLAPVVSLPATAVDSFLIDKVLKRDGVATFINKLYPKLF